MKFQLRADAPEKVEVGFSGRAFICERGNEPFECRDLEWPVLERKGYFEPYQEPMVETSKPAEKQKK